MEKIGYIYLTTNLVNGKQYVGQHLSEGFDTGYKGSGKAVKAAFVKYGWDNFKCEIICWCSTQTQLNEAEDNYIRLLDTMSPNGYNLKGGGANGRYSKESRKKQSEARKKYFENEDNRKNISEANKKYYANEENRKKASETHKKYWESEEGIKARKKQSEVAKKYYANEENRKKQSEANKKYYESEENRKKTSEAVKKCWKNEETRKKHSESSKKYWENDEYRKKQLDSQINNPKKSKKVYQYTLNKVLIKEWCSLSEIERVLGYANQNISACCNGKVKTSHKHLWSYEPLI